MQVNVNKINSILEGSFKKREESEDSIVLQTITEEIVDKKTARGTKFQKTASPATRHISPFTIKKRKKVIPNLIK